MLVIFKDKNKRSNSGRTNSMNIIIYTRWISRCMEGEFVRRLGSRRIFVGIKKRVWRRR